MKKTFWPDEPLASFPSLQKNKQEASLTLQRYKKVGLRPSVVERGEKGEQAAGEGAEESRGCSAWSFFSNLEVDRRAVR